MSDVLYPIGQIASSSIDLVTHTIKDNFEDGSQSARRLWSANNFKRRFKIKHAPLTVGNFRYLRSFFSARSGEYDAFWYRDNIHRTGNASVRLASPFPIERSGTNVYEPSLTFEEIAPIKLLPEYEEVSVAAGLDAYAGSIFLMWLDANRDIEYTNSGDIVQGMIHDSVMKNWGRNDDYYTAHDLTPQFAQPKNTSLFNSIVTQYQDYHFNTDEYYKTSVNFSPAAGAQAACTIFCIAKNDTSVAKKVLFGAGTMGAGKCIGLCLSAANNYEPWIGGTEVWTGAQFANSAANTFRSFAVTWASASNTAKLYVNGALIGSVSNTRSYVDGPFAFGAAPDGTLKVNDAFIDNGMNHAMVWQNELALAQIKSLHNLFAYQYGLATV